MMTTMRARRRCAHCQGAAAWYFGFVAGPRPLTRPLAFLCYRRMASWPCDEFRDVRIAVGLGLVGSGRMPCIERGNVGGGGPGAQRIVVGRDVYRTSVYSSRTKMRGRWMRRMRVEMDTMFGRGPQLHEWKASWDRASCQGRLTFVRPNAMDWNIYNMTLRSRVCSSVYDNTTNCTNHVDLLAIVKSLTRQ